MSFAEQLHSNASYVLLGLVVEKVAGVSYFDYVREHVFLKAGMADSADAGEPVVLSDPDSPASQALGEIARNVIDSAGGRSVALPVITG